MNNAGSCKGASVVVSTVEIEQGDPFVQSGTGGGRPGELCSGNPGNIEDVGVADSRHGDTGKERRSRTSTEIQTWVVNNV